MEFSIKKVKFNLLGDSIEANEYPGYLLKKANRPINDTFRKSQYGLLTMPEGAIVYAPADFYKKYTPAKSVIEQKREAKEAGKRLKFLSPELFSNHFKENLKEEDGDVYVIIIKLNKELGESGNWVELERTQSIQRKQMKQMKSGNEYALFTQVMHMIGEVGVLKNEVMLLRNELETLKETKSKK
jgi:hypothetical protein